MGALIIFGWFPVFQAILYLNQRDKERAGMESCRFCGKSITFAYREWWDESGDNKCGETTHIPFLRTSLAPTPVVSTMGPVAKWRKNGGGRLVPLKGKRAKERRLVTDE